MEIDIKCPVCGSEQVSASRRGFDVSRALLGAALTDDAIVSLLAGSIGKDDVVFTCDNCGHQFSPADVIGNNQEVPAAETDKLPADNTESCGKGGCAWVLLIPLVLLGGILVML